MSRWRKMGLLNLCWVSSDWSFFLLGGNRAFNFMLILSITAKCDLKTPSALSARTFMSACMCICVWVSTTEQVARAPSPRLNPAPSFLCQLMRYELLSLLSPPSFIFLVSFCLYRWPNIILSFPQPAPVYPSLYPHFFYCSPAPCFCILLSCRVSSQAVIISDWLVECCCPSDWQREQYRSFI